MIQILGIRTYFDQRDGKEKKKDAFFDKNWRAASIEDLLSNWPIYLSQIPEAERYNIFFTQAMCTEKKRGFREQWVIPFDIDSVDLGAHTFNEYLDAFCDSTGLPANALTVIFSGHGLQLMVNLKEPFTSVEYFDEKRSHYYSICDRINLTLSQRGLHGHMDRGMWKPLIFFRLPGTENRKPDKPIQIVKLLQHSKFQIDFNWSEISKMPEVSHSDQVSEREYPAIDTKGVCEGCDFLKHCKCNPSQINEGAWYAMLSILGRLEKGEELAHEYSKGHPGYSYEETQVKLEQALQSSGPRTCKNIEGMFKGCRNCPNYKKVSSPITIKSRDFIETERTGFHKVHFNSKGLKTVGKPAFDDLRKFFAKSNQYKIMGASEICYVWKGTHYEILEDVYLEAFAQEMFEPKALSFMVKEFKDLVCRTQLIDPNWFQTTTEKRINFKNGVLDLRTGGLEPHSPEYGFRYVLPYEYNPLATCPTFDKFLSEVTQGDQDLADLLMEFSGYAFSGDWPWATKVLVLTGDGSNGKSTFIDVMRSLAGKANYSSLSWKDMNNPTILQMLEGKLFNISEETPKHAIADSTLFKNLIGGGEITVRMLYKQAYSIMNKTKLIFACNELPRSEDTTNGFFRRLIIAPFKAEFSREKGNIDPHIREKLIAELPGVFNLVMKGYRRLTDRGAFIDSKTADSQLKEYQIEIDHAKRWIGENVCVLPVGEGEKFSVLAEMYQSYRNEMLNTGEKPLTAVSFGKKLSKLIPEYKSRAMVKKVGGKSVRVIIDATFQSGVEV